VYEEKMSQEKTTLEIIAPTIEEAVQKGLDQLGLKSDMVETEVLDQGSKGLFGLGSRQARVRLTIRSFTDEKRSLDFASEDSAATEIVESAVKTLDTTAVTESSPEFSEELSEEEEELRVSKTVLEDLLERMGVRATVDAQLLEPLDSKDRSTISLNIQGNDLSILIGRRSETLNALQYITNLIVGKRLGHWVPLVVDVQGYRNRREQQLRKMARRMADQAINTGRRQVLEPMPANERRFIHLELRNHDKVYTESVGDEPGRKVTIHLRKN
jgi:spoIIIJ-associated protein